VNKELLFLSVKFVRESDSAGKIVS